MPENARELIDEVYLGCLQDELSTAACQNLKVVSRSLYRLTGRSHILSPDGLNNTFLSQGYVLETAARMRMVRGTYISRTGEQVRSF